MARRQAARPTLTAEMKKFCEEETVRLLPFIEKIARLTKLPLPIEDLIQEGALAAFQALPRFDTSRGVKVETWIAPRIFGALRDFARKMGRLMKGGERTGRVERIVSIDKTVQHQSADGPIAVKDLIQAPPSARRLHTADGWSEILAGLSQRERLLLIGYFIEDRTMREIGRDLRLSESRVCQMMSQIIVRLRSDRGDRMRDLVA
jgi:RNA polymerase sigma factor for flagellar operon FliA